MDSATKQQVFASEVFQAKVNQLCSKAPADAKEQCTSQAGQKVFCLLLSRSSQASAAADNGCGAAAPADAPAAAPAFLQVRRHRGPEDDLAKEMTHDLEMNFNKIAPFGKEDTARELQDHVAKTQDTLVDAVENAEVAEIKRAVFRALTRLRAATIKEFDTI